MNTISKLSGDDTLPNSMAATGNGKCTISAECTGQIGSVLYRSGRRGRSCVLASFEALPGMADTSGQGESPDPLWGYGSGGDAQQRENGECLWHAFA